MYSVGDRTEIGGISMTENNEDRKKDQFIIVLAKILSAMTGLCLAILVFSMANIGVLLGFIYGRQ